MKAGDREATGSEPFEAAPARRGRAGRKRRRPSGEPPPLPKSLQSSGKIAVGALTGVLLLLTIIALTTAGAAFDRTESSILKTVESWRVDDITGTIKHLDALGSTWAIGILRWGTVLVLLFAKRFRHLFVFLGSILVVGFISTTIATTFVRARPYGIDIIGAWQGSSLPSRPVAALAVTLVGITYSLVPAGTPRNRVKVILRTVLLGVALTRVYLGVDHPTDVLVGMIIGAGIPLIAFRIFTPNDVFPVTYKRGKGAHLDLTGARGPAIKRAVEEQLGLVITDMKPFGLAGSGGSTPIRLVVEGADGPEVLFAKLYARNHLRADRWYKLGRTLLYGRLEDEGSFSTVRRLVQYEDYMLRVMRDGGVDVPKTYGFVEITPEREYLLVTQFLEGGVEVTDAEVDEDVIDKALRIVRKLWEAGLAHRDIKPSNILIVGGEAHLIDVAFGEVRPSPWRQAVDLANMMIVLALRSDARTVYERALRFFSADEIAEAFAATHGVTIPSQSRGMMRKEKSRLLEEFRALAPKRRTIPIQRWSFRRVQTTIGVFLAAFVVFLLAVDNLVGAGLLGAPDATQASYAVVVRAPECRGPGEVLALEAQSVPTAAYVPCMAALPLGWSFHVASVRSGSSRIYLDSDRLEGTPFYAELTRSCDFGDATQVPTDEPGTRRYERVTLDDENYVGERYYVFEGGCVTYHFDFEGTGRTALAEEASLAMSLFSRAKGVELLREIGLEL